MMAAAAAARHRRARCGSGACECDTSINDAMRQKAEDDRRREALGSFIADFEAEHGVVTDGEIAAVTRAMAARAVVVRGRKRTRRAAGDANDDERRARRRRIDCDRSWLA